MVFWMTQLSSKGKARATEDDESSFRQTIPKPIAFHSCFGNADVELDEVLAALIQRSTKSVIDQHHDWLTSPNIPTEFDLWIHSQLLLNAGSFNAL